MTTTAEYSKAPKNAFYVDDNWISGWLRYNEIKLYMTGTKYKNFPFSNLTFMETPFRALIAP
jgi:hypothetical protein